MSANRITTNDTDAPEESDALVVEATNDARDLLETLNELYRAADGQAEADAGTTARDPLDELDKIDTDGGRRR
ncbi:MAG: hypothetical protein ABEJ55_08450 [Halanaeroarchaeum sp.]